MQGESVAEEYLGPITDGVSALVEVSALVRATRPVQSFFRVDIRAPKRLFCMQIFHRLRILPTSAHKHQKRAKAYCV